MATKFILGDTWQEITDDSVSVDETAARADRLPSDAIEFSNVFMPRGLALTTTPETIALPVVVKYCDACLVGSGTDHALIQLGGAVDGGGLVIPAGGSIKIPLQRVRSITVKMSSGTGTLYLAANNEPFRVW